MPPPKSASTCTQCRARKVPNTQLFVRCDGGPNPCSNCERLNFACSFATSESPSRPERRRGTRACLQCRTQKSKCSGELPACAACRSRDKTCVYPDLKRPSRSAPAPPISSATTTHAGAAATSPALGHHAQPQQPSPSDISPRDGAFTSPSLTAAPDAASSLPPEPSPQQSASWRGSISNTGLSNGTHSLPLPPMQDRLHLIIDFFRHLHPLPPYAFLNEVSVTQRCLEGTLDETLLLALCAVSALHLKHSKYHPLSTASWIQRAEDIVWSRIEQPTIFRTQALLLIVQYRIEAGSFQRAYMLLGIAGRAASALRLQYERIDLGHLAQEIRRRLMWCMMLLNCHFSIGLPESEVCSPDFIYLKLPCNEDDFHAECDLNEDLGNSLSTLDGPPENGLFSTCIRESMIRRDIVRLMRQVRLSSQPMPHLPDLVDEFVSMLQQLQIPLYSSQELERYSTSRWLVRYVSVHLSWHQAHCDAYRLFLSGYREAAPEVVISSCPPAYVAMAAKLCLHHAQANIAILNDLAELGTCPVATHNDVAICGYHACRIVLFLSRSTLASTDLNITPDAAFHQASSVLAFFQRLYKDSALLQYLTKDLESLVRSHAAGEADHRRDSSEQEEEQQPRFAVAVQRHKSLGVHSVLRRAGFVDDSAEAAEPSGRGRSQDTDMAIQADALSNPQPSPLRMTTQQPLANTILDESHLGFDALMRAAMVPSPLAGSFDGPQSTIPSEPFTLGPWEAWNNWSWQGTFSPRSDADYL
ncbi:hypothetical protein FDECE_14510 [Fusarium decemcellulare]|nr:hypothetical protein FDECE_14510 [Fusarium decemcellulare]